MVVQPSQAISQADQHYKCEVPMDLILKRLTECQRLGRLFNPDAFYVESREMFVDWMCDLSDRLRVQPETFHHSVNIFDAYLQRSDIKQHLAGIKHFQGQPRPNVITLIGLTCVFISAKYLEKTYPGINQLLNFIGIPYNYDQFVTQEADILNTLDWRLQFVSIYDVLTHFLCQGIVFTTDKIQSADGTLGTPTAYTAGILQHNAEVFTSKCLKKHEFLKYDQLTLVCGIVMSARKVCKFVELWPDELVAMTGNRLRYP
jgi:hypothetical protein